MKIVFASKKRRKNVKRNTRKRLRDQREISFGKEKLFDSPQYQNFPYIRANSSVEPPSCPAGSAASCVAACPTPAPWLGAVCAWGRTSARSERRDASSFVTSVRSGLNNWFIFSKLREARSRLYRRQLLRPNTRWKALDEIYKMYILLHRSDLKISRKGVIILAKLNQFIIQFIRIFASLALQLLFYF